MKKLFCGLMTLLVSATFVLGGCSLFGGNSTEIDVTVNNSYTSMTDEQWQEYKQLLIENGSDDTRFQTAVNGSLMAGVSILSTFSYNDLVCYVDTAFGSTKQVGRMDYNSVYCGAGVIVELDKPKGDAYVITNCHVVYDDSSKEIISNDVRLYLYGQDSKEVNYKIQSNYITYGGNKVYFNDPKDGEEYYLLDNTVTDDEKYCVKAEVIGASIDYDIALLKVTNSSVLKNSNAVTADFCASDEVYAGVRAYAVGNPEGDGMSATVGYVTKESEIISLNLSDKDENAYKYYRVIRTDAAVNGGNSGGGFYGVDGKLLGIVNSKTEGEDIDNMAYVLPASNVKRLWKLMQDTSGSYFNKKSPYVKAAKFPAEYTVASCTSYINPQGLAEIAETVVVSSGAGNFRTGDVLRHITIKNGGTVVEDKDITRSYHIDDTLLSARDGYTVIFKVLRGGVETEVSYTASLERI